MKELHNYICEECGKSFSTPEEALACEAADTEVRIKKENLAKEREERRLQIKADYDKYVEDYGCAPFVIYPRGFSVFDLLD